MDWQARVILQFALAAINICGANKTDAERQWILGGSRIPMLGAKGSAAFVIVPYLSSLEIAGQSRVLLAVRAWFV